jgi:molybdopterin-guanine dinucleotide biosynthesis protein A
MISDSVSAIILAGGQSRRMQREKSLLPVNGRTLIESVIAQISPHCEEIIISTAAKDKFAFLKLPLVEDEMPGQGPLIAIMSALRVSAHAINFVLACDIPFIHIPFMQEIISLAKAHDIVVPRYRDGRFESLFAAYNRSIIPVIETQIKKGDLKISHLFPVCHTKFVPMDDEKWFRNLNTLKEYHDYFRKNKTKLPCARKRNWAGAPARRGAAQDNS